MKTTLTFPIIFLFACLTAPAIHANDISYLHTDVSQTWEAHTNVSLALCLITSKQASSSGTALRIYIKNVSNTDIRFLRNNGDEGVKIFYAEGASYLSLRDYKSASTHLSNLLPPDIKPGDILCITLDLSSSEVVLLKSHLVKCELTFFNPITSQKFIEISTPRVLSAN